MSQLQIEEILGTRKIPESIKIVAPARGIVLARNIAPGLKFDRGAEWYRIADLKKVWVVATVFEREAGMVRPGMSARVAIAGQARSVQATVSEVLPQFDVNTNAFKVRLEADNPGYALRPDMFVDIELALPFNAAITVPVDAILDSGLEKTVFVEHRDGDFESRRVTTGWRFDGRVQVTSGLEPGERIVIAGNFLINSESRLKTGMAVISHWTKDPACDVEVDRGRASAEGLTSTYGGETFYFSSDSCKRKFDGTPARYVRAPQTSSPPSAATRPQPVSSRSGRSGHHG